MTAFPPFGAYVLGVVHCFAITCMAFGTNTFTVAFGASLLVLTTAALLVGFAWWEMRRKTEARPSSTDLERAENRHSLASPSTEEAGS